MVSRDGKEVLARRQIVKVFTDGLMSPVEAGGISLSFPHVCVFMSLFLCDG